jgi:hypothetical protein
MEKIRTAFINAMNSTEKQIENRGNKENNLNTRTE